MYLVTINETGKQIDFESIVISALCLPFVTRKDLAVKLIEWVKKQLFYFYMLVKTVLVYNFKLVCVVLRPSVKGFFKKIY